MPPEVAPHPPHSNSGSLSRQSELSGRAGSTPARISRNTRHNAVHNRLRHLGWHRSEGRRKKTSAIICLPPLMRRVVMCNGRLLGSWGCFFVRKSILGGRPGHDGGHAIEERGFVAHAAPRGHLPAYCGAAGPVLVSLR